MLSARIVLFFTINSMIHISYVGLIINHMFSFECCVYCTHSVTEVYWTREPRKGTSLQPAHISQNGKLQFCTRSMLEDGPHRTKNREQWSGAHCLLNFVNCKCRHVSKGGGELPLPPLFWIHHCSTLGELTPQCDTALSRSHASALSRSHARLKVRFSFLVPMCFANFSSHSIVSYAGKMFLRQHLRQRQRRGSTLLKIVVVVDIVRTQGPGHHWLSQRIRIGAPTNYVCPFLWCYGRGGLLSNSVTTTWKKADGMSLWAVLSNSAKANLAYKHKCPSKWTEGWLLLSC